MTEKIVKESFDFLCENYSMSYIYQEFKGYHDGVNSLFTYSYYNNYGCFTITNYPVIGDVSYIRLDSIHSLKDYILASQSVKIKHDINIYNEEPEVWAKHRKKLFLKFLLGCDGKRTLQALSEVIQTQIDKKGEFFGIKVDKK